MTFQSQIEATESVRPDKRSNQIAGTNMNIIQFPSGSRELTATPPEWQSDATNLSQRRLRELYPLTFSSFQCTVYNRGKGPNGEKHHNIDPAIRSFAGFLLAFGPRRDARLTLDRSDHLNERYGPGLCSWQDKKGQARNRKNTILVQHPRTMESVCLVAFAEEIGVPASRMRRQHRDGWTPEDMLAGRRLLGGKRDKWPWRLAPVTERHWEDRYRNERRDVGDDLAELRVEFAVRWLKSFCKVTSKWLVKIAETYIDPNDPCDISYMPTELYDELRRRSDLLLIAQERLSLAQKAIHQFGDDNWPTREKISSTAS